MGCKPTSVHGYGDCSLNDDKMYHAADGRSFHAEFVLVGKLGKGAFAQVYEVKKAEQRDPRDTSTLAVKIMDLRVDRNTQPHSELEEVDSKRKAAAEKEAQILRAVSQLPNCLTMIDFLIEGCFSYMVTERCDRTLLQSLEQIPLLNEHTLKPILREMFEALVGIHRLQVVHRDVKPDNFLVSSRGAALERGEIGIKLCDFGLAAEAPPNGGNTLTGVYGTPPYMSPEMLACRGYGKGLDVWSLGVIAYVLLLGQFPYKPAEQTGKAMKAAIKAGVPAPSFRPRASSSGPVEISDSAIQTLRALLERQPDNRLSAEAALHTRWFSFASRDEHEIKNASSLRTMLYAARRIGAFDPPPRKSDQQIKTGVDLVMVELQEKLHKRCTTPMNARVPRTPLSSASTEVGTSAGQSVTSHFDFHTPGVVG